ncbi:hypothetical protein EVJ58_g5444 [Rhodofomes roseus]|uniref:TFIIS central domain-containing protein n=1 Tax=Rhodofomes roseus TaxID=34475 RepID=A0A4Y9YBL7_9APHY|nr:hypothetical protein EVJ58_g5444 [Rhodofomes roseus]
MPARQDTTTKQEELDAKENAKSVWNKAKNKRPRTAMEWEGVDGLEAINDGSKPKAPIRKHQSPDSGRDTDMNSPESDNGSGDEYVAEESKPRVTVKRRSRRVSVSSNSDSDSEGSTKRQKGSKRLRRTSTTTHESGVRKSTSPGATSLAKRRQPGTAEPPAKRAKPLSGEDPARKYCLTKFEEVFCPIFLRYPFLDGVKATPGLLEPNKKQEDLTDEEKEKLEMTARRFAADLEHRVFDLYADTDKNGKRAVGSKYKERFRMLTFNLSKPDRALLHKRIASSSLTPNELSTMTSTELADEETKLSIRHAEEEALAHSILKKQSLPRAKITHKGIENIEDVNGAGRDVERAREEQEEEERIERERQARLRLQAERARSVSTQGQGSVPPESPVVPQTPTWGAPPPVPLHASHSDVNAGASVSGMGRPPTNPLFVPTASDYQVPVEGELNLADFINIDEDIPSDVPALAPTPTPFGEDTPPPFQAQSPGAQSLPPSDGPAPTSSTGISPFAAKPDLASRPSFDLNALWISKGENPGEEQSTGPQDVPMQDGEPGPVLEPDALGQAADDQDFDMFLGKDEEDQPAPPPPVDNSPEGQRAAFEALPRVWTGTLSMPLDSAMAQDVSLNARQSGGRMLGDDSPLWQTLFPSKELRIDGRVPVDKSAQYLTQMRLNPSKELTAVAFSPEPGPGIESTGFKLLIDHLIAKGRHGLVFPWGNRPKDWAPGRELYIIPLLMNDPIPEYMELLDDLCIPKQRTSNYLVGIWVLNKGKLAPPPTASASAPPFSVPGAPPIQLPQSLLDLLPSITNQSQPQMQPQPFAVPPAQPPPMGSALAAEVAQLTPEQIQLMLRTLTSTTLVPPQPAPGPSHPAIPAVPQVPVPIGYPPQQPVLGQQPIPLQPWLNPSSSYPPSYQPPPQNMYPGQGPPPSHSYPDMHQDYYERDRPGSAWPFSTVLETVDPEGGDGNGEGGRDREQDRPRDSGWKSRGRGGGASGPPRGRGRSDHPGWS